MDFLKIDGGFGEGGGQIVRTAITLSCITKQPIIIENIRKNRKNGGLKPQHLTAINILRKTCDATVEGAVIGSTSLKFVPGEVKEANLEESIGTAGSISLILQVLIPVSAICQKRLELTIKGGTDVLWSPTIDYTRYVLREAYRKLGIDFSVKLIRRGYYPKGGGKIKLDVFPSKIKSVSLTERKTTQIKLSCSFSKLPKEMIYEKTEKIKSKLMERKFVVQETVKEEEAVDSGSSLLISTVDDNSVIGIDCIYDKRSNEFDLNLAEITENNLGVDDNLADMLVLPASLASGMTVFRVPKITRHLETNLFVISKITGCRYGVGKVPGGYEVRVEGTSYPCVQ